MKTEAPPIIEHYVMPEGVEANITKWKEHFRILKERQIPQQADRTSPEYLEAMELLAKDLRGS